jgi:hypothetical protein
LIHVTAKVRKSPKGIGSRLGVAIGPRSED